MEPKGSHNFWSRLIRWIQRLNCIFNGTLLCVRDSHLHWIPVLCMFGPNIKLSWYQTLLMATFSSSAYILCLWVHLSLLQLQSAEWEIQNSELRKLAIKNLFCDIAVTCLIYFFWHFSCCIGSQDTPDGPPCHVSCPHVSVNVRTLSSLSGTGPAVSGKIKGNSRKISPKDDCSWH